MNRIYLSLGSNQGNRRTNLEQALVLIGGRAGLIKARSSVYETEPWGFRSALNFYNQAVELLTDLKSAALLDTIHEIEIICGRMPVAKRYAPRPIDIDILFFNDEIIDEPTLKVPHPFLHLRRFVLVPMSEIAPDLVHPVLKRNIRELLQECSDDKRVVKWLR